MSKKNMILGGILVVLIALAYAYQGPLKDWRERMNRPKNFLAGIESTEITGIKITKNGTTTELIKEDDKWRIGGTKSFYVSDSATSNLSSALSDLASANFSLISTNQANKDSFGTGTSTGLMIGFSQGDQVLVEFILGKLGSDYSSTYISRPEDNNTYATDKNIRLAFDPGDWYDHQIVSVDQDKIASIRFQYPDSEFTLEKQDNGWQGVKPYSFSVDQDKISDVLGVLANLSAVKIPAQTFIGTGLEKNSMIVQIAGDGLDETLMVGDQSSDGDYYAKRADSDNIYLISPNQHDKLKASIAELK